jgi:hypothetical protein
MQIQVNVKEMEEKEIEKLMETSAFNLVKKKVK